jgi:SAM-dependent methyltransferase
MVVLLFTTLVTVVSLRSEYIIPHITPYWRGTIEDTAIADSFCCAIWLGALAVVGGRRLYKYRHSATSIPGKAYVSIYPLAAGALFAALTAVVLMLAAHGYGNHLGPLLVAIPFLVGMEFFGVQKWCRDLAPEFISRLLSPGWSVLLGPRFGVASEKHVRDVLDFQNRFDRCGPASIEDLKRRFYSQADAFHVFQGTLSSPSQTAPYVASIVRPGVAGCLSWTMTDVGCGDGTFTAELLAALPTKPHRLIYIDPAADTLDSYEQLISARYPSINLRRYCEPIEECYDKLERTDIILASHSLYYLLDNDLKKAKDVLEQLLSKSARLVCILASQHSDAYKVKRAILDRLGVPDRSSFGSDIMPLLPTRLRHCGTRDSFMEVSRLLECDESLIKWCSYFCRVDSALLEADVSFLRALIEHASIGWNSLPSTLASGLAHVACASRKQAMPQDCRILLHKEDVISVFDTDPH